MGGAVVLAALLFAVSLLISLDVSAQAQTQRPAQRPAQLPPQATGVVTEPLAAAPFRPIIVDLGAACSRHSSALAVNAAGVVAGDCDYRAALWQNNAWTELGALSGGNGTAIAINDAGLVAGNSRIVNSEWPGGVYHAVLWDLWDNTSLFLPEIKLRAP